MLSLPLPFAFLPLSALPCLPCFGQGELVQALRITSRCKGAGDYAPEVYIPLPLACSILPCSCIFCLFLIYNFHKRSHLVLPCELVSGSPLDVCLQRPGFYCPVPHTTL